METATNLDDKTKNALRVLIRMNADAAEGFGKAADTVETPDVAQRLRAAGLERGRFHRELSSAMNISGEEAPDAGTPIGDLHRWWIGVRGALNGGDDKVVLAEATRGEGALEQAYESALMHTAGSPLNATLLDHVAVIKKERDEFQQLKSAG